MVENTIKDKIKLLDDKVKGIEGEFKKPKGKKFKLPFKYRGSRKYKDGRVLCLWLGSNHRAEFKFGYINGGLIVVDGKSYYAYEKGAVYHYKKYPFVVIFEWRLTPVGGSAENAYYKTKAEPIGGDDDKKFADDNGLAAHAQQTIIRSIQNAKIDAEDTKKGSKSKMIILLAVGGIVVYVILKAMGLM